MSKIYGAFEGTLLNILINYLNQIEPHSGTDRPTAHSVEPRKRVPSHSITRGVGTNLSRTSCKCLCRASESITHMDLQRHQMFSYL